MKNIFLLVGLGLFLTGCEEASLTFGSTDSKTFLVCDGYEEIKYKVGDYEQETTNSAYDEQHSLVVDKKRKRISFKILEAPYEDNTNFIWAEDTFIDETTITVSFDIVTGELSRTEYAGVDKERFVLPIVSTERYNCKKVEPLI